MPFTMVFNIANPSRYTRSDFVDVDLDQLNVPGELGEEDLRLSKKVGEAYREIAFQVDRPFGTGSRERIMTFLAANTPGGPDDYSAATDTYLLEQLPRKKQGHSNPNNAPSDFWIKYYHAGSKTGEPTDGCNDEWDPSRTVNGVKLSNGAVEVYVHLVPRIEASKTLNLAGAITSVMHRRVKQHTNEVNMLAPQWLAPRTDLACWGQLTKLVLFPLPWERRWYHSYPLLIPDCEYELAYARQGPLRAVIVLKSQPFDIRFDGQPFFPLGAVELKCRLYRVFSVRPRVDGWTDAHLESYQEQLCVRTDEHGKSLAFRPYYSSFLPFEENTARATARFEDIPDFFAVWRQTGDFSWGYGFAVDSHCREVRCHGDTIDWRLQLSHIHNCTHQFMFHERSENPRFERKHRGLHQIGHFGWYERIFKPLEVVPLYKYLPRDADG